MISIVSVYLPLDHKEIEDIEGLEEISVAQHLASLRNALASIANTTKRREGYIEECL